MEIEDMKRLKEYFQKAGTILGDLIKLKERLDQAEDEKEIEKINNKIEEKLGKFMVQMLKIQQIQ